MTDDFAETFSEEISEPCPEGRGVTIDDFRAYMPSHTYIFTPCREFWPASSVNARLPKMPVLNKNGQPKPTGTANSSPSRRASGSTRIGRSSR